MLGTQTPTTTVYVLSELQSSLTTVPLQEASDTTTAQAHGSRGARARDPRPYMVWEVSSQQPGAQGGGLSHMGVMPQLWKTDRKSTRLNSSHVAISYAVFCLKKKKK